MTTPKDYGFSPTIWEHAFEYKRAHKQGFVCLQNCRNGRWRWAVWQRTDEPNPFFRGADVNKCVAENWNYKEGEASIEEAMNAINETMKQNRFVWL